MFNYLSNKNFDRKPVYLSLYGLQSVESISKMILSVIYEPNNKYSATGITKLKEIIDKKIGLELSDEIISFTINYDKYYFIFDDLERCSIPVNDTLGYINNFIEQNNAKVLVVSSEDEIVSVEQPTNKLMRNLIAVQESINCPEKKKIGFYDNTINNIKSKPDLEDIEYRADILLDQNTFYHQVKEKII